MSKGKVPPEQSADTQEFGAVQSIEGVNERREFELVGHYRLPIKADFQHPIELRLGRDEQTPICYLVRNPWHMGQRGEYAVVQPTVVRTHPGRGWIEFGERMLRMGKIGRLVSPELKLGPDVSRRHCLIATSNAGEDDAEVLEIENYGRNGLRVLVHPDDLTGTIHEFDPAETWQAAAENDPEPDRDLRSTT